MDATTVAVDLAKDVMAVAEANASGKIVVRQRLSRLAFSRYIAGHPVCRWVMEACGGAHYWAICGVMWKHGDDYNGNDAGMARVAITAA